jgi:hypothetical protein
MVAKLSGGTGVYSCVRSTGSGASGGLGRCVVGGGGAGRGGSVHGSFAATQRAHLSPTGSQRTCIFTHLSQATLCIGRASIRLRNMNAVQQLGWVKIRKPRRGVHRVKVCHNFGHGRLFQAMRYRFLIVRNGPRPEIDMIACTATRVDSDSSVVLVGIDEDQIIYLCLYFCFYSGPLGSAGDLALRPVQIGPNGRPRLAGAAPAS